MVRSRQRTGARHRSASALVGADQRTKRRIETRSLGHYLVTGVSILATILLGVNALVQAISVCLRWF